MYLQKKFFMKEMIIRVPEDSVAFIEELVEKIGGDVTEIKIKSSAKKKKTEDTKAKRPKPLDFFGTWPDIDLDPKTYRKKLWRKTPEF
jgi:hypothetical protein